MSFLSISGLSDGSGGDDALQRLMSASGIARGADTQKHDGAAAAKSVSSAPRTGTAFCREAEEEWARPVRSHGTPSVPAPAAASPPQTAPVEAAPQKQQRRIPNPDATAAAAAASAGSSSFKADNPTDADELPSLAELVHPKLRCPLMETMKIQSMTRIQRLSWKAVLDRDRDVLVRSETGSGKTLAYALPIAHQILSQCDVSPISRDVGTLVIIMCPTRELVLQVTDTLTALLRCAQFLTVGGIHGGENRHKEKARLRKGIPILVTTPGRLLDHLKATNAFTVENTQTIVMDEADRLLDLGFEKPIREIMGLLETKCKAHASLKRVLVSATITDGVERLTHFALRKDAAHIGETQDTFSIPATLKQHYVSVPVKHRLALLISFLRSQFDAGATKIVVFVSTADSTEFLYYLVSRLQSPFNKREYGGRVETRKTPQRSTKKMVEMANQHIFGEGDEVVTFDEGNDDSADDENEENGRDASGVGLRGKTLIDANVFKLHGNMNQVDRASVFHSFKFGTSATAKNKKAVLFCTDVAARGLDMPQIDWIVHYDAPTDPASYVHRVGRTARIGNSGDSILFLAPHEVGYASYLTSFIHSHSDASFTTCRDMVEKKYETFLFYLTKLDPKSNHMWIQSTATLERGISQLVMRKDGNDSGQDSSKDKLDRIALFAYQSYIRSYSGISKELRALFFNPGDLHLGHVAQSFGIDKSPSEVQRQLQGYIREDRILARDNRKGTTVQDANATKRKRQRVELEHDDRYHSMLAQKQRKVTRDWAEKRREESTKIRPLQFSEFDA